MSMIQTERTPSGVVQITLCSGRGNPLTLDLLHALRAEIETCAADPSTRALLLGAGSSKIFSGGFALPVIASWNRDRLREFFTVFLDVMQSLLHFPHPTVAAVNGHAIAGGFILSLACDLRVVRETGLKLGLSEVDLAVAVPKGTQVLLAARTSPQTSLRMSMLGLLIDGAEAYRVGYADQLAEDANAAGLALAETLARKPGRGSGVTRSMISADLAQRVAQADAEGLETFLDTWFSTEGQTRIKAMAARLSGKR